MMFRVANSWPARILTVGMVFIFALTDALPIFAKIGLRSRFSNHLAELFSNEDCKTPAPLPPRIEPTMLKLYLAKDTSSYSADSPEEKFLAKAEPKNPTDSLVLAYEQASHLLSAKSLANPFHYPALFHEKPLASMNAFGRLGLFGFSLNHEALLQAPPDSNEFAGGPPPDSLRTENMGDAPPQSPNEKRKPGATAGSGSSAQVDTSSLSPQQKASLDSLNRLLDNPDVWHEQFRLKPKPQIAARPIDQTASPFFFKENSIQRQVDLDSLGQTLTITEQLDGYDVRTPIQVPFDLYRDLRLKAAIRSNFESLISEQTRFEQGDALEEVMGKLTKLKIYIPGGENSFFSTLFGPPTVSLQITGNIDIDASYSMTDTQNPTLVAAGTNVTQDPNFDQAVSLNLSGEIGDKLTILADWDTDRPFDYENQLSIKYQGYEDDIIQSIEAGNVSLTLPTSLISSSQALFGVKASTQLGGLSLTAIASQKQGKNQTLSISSGSEETEVEIRAWNYDYNQHFFLSNFFITNWDDAFSSTEPLIQVPTDDLGRQLGRVDVWVWKPSSTSTDRNAVAAFLYLGDQPSTNVSGDYSFPSEYYYKSDGTQLSLETIEEYRDTIPESADNKTVVVGNFQRLEEGTDYVLNTSLGYISFITQINDEDAIAVAYEFSKTGVDPITIGDFVDDDDVDKDKRLILKLVKPPNMTSEYLAWDLMLKNIYSLGATNVQEDGFELDIVYETPGNAQSETQVLPSSPELSSNLLNVLGLDRFDESNAVSYDGNFDYMEGLTINATRGWIIFPYIRPFSTRITEVLEAVGASATDFSYDKIYEDEQSSAKQDADKNLYIIRANYKSEAQSTYSLGFNLVEGSVVVTTSSGKLTEGVDYEVDYQLGTVSILNSNALQTGSNLSITYEQNELLTISSKTILGARAEYDFSDDFQVGSTFLRYSEEPLTEKIRVSDEPVQNSIYGFDTQFSTKINWLTKLVNALPLISTKTASEFTISAEYAHVLPSHPSELNTSTDPDGVSYIDDFDATKEVISLGKDFSSWSMASPPIFGDDNKTDTKEAKERLNQKALLAWYNYTQDNALLVTDIFPERDVASNEKTIIPLVLDYYPSKRGAYNFSSDLKTTLYENPDSAWGGMMRLLPQYARKLEESNVDFIEFWLKVDEIDGLSSDSGYLYIDLGTISEDVLPNGQLNTEDGMPLTSTEGTSSGQRDDDSRYGKDDYGRYLLSSATAFLVNSILNSDASNSSLTEDIGIDGLTDDEELSYEPFVEFVESATASLSGDANYQEELARIKADPSGDDYSPPDDYDVSEDYIGYNGVEGNSRTGIRVTSNLPETEDLNSNNVVDSQNEFFRYKIAIRPEIFQSISPEGKYVVGGGQSNDNFVQFRIPLDAPDDTVGSAPSLNSVSYVRIWVGGFKKPQRFEFASLDFIGSQWYAYPTSDPDENVAISAINIEENSANYALPPDVDRERDLSNTEETVYENEQSIVLTAYSVEPDTFRAISRDLTYGSSSLNLNPYKRLRAYVHGEYDPMDTRNDSLYAFIRFGYSETNNYYEYRIKIQNPTYKKAVSTPASSKEREALWPSENEIDIDLTSLSAYKLSTPDSITGLIQRTLDDGNELVIKGSPSLGSIRYFVLGLLNKGEYTVDTAAVWFNELRVSGYEESEGWAFKTSATLKLADFITMSGSYQKQTADFHSIYVRQNALSSQNETKSWSVSSTVNADKFLPVEDGWKIPVTAEHTEALSVPKYSPTQTDVLLEKLIERAIADTIANGATEEDAKRYGETLRTEAETYSVSNRLSMSSIQKANASDFWLSRYTLDRLTLSFNYTNSYSRSPTIKSYDVWSWQSSLNYGLQLPEFYIEPLGFLGAIPLIGIYKDFRLYYLPQTYALSVSMNRQRSQKEMRSESSTGSFSSTLLATRGLNFNYKLTETFNLKYTSQMTSSLNNYVYYIDSVQVDTVINNVDTTVTTAVSREVAGSATLDSVLNDISNFTLGNDKSFSQTVAMSWKPKMIAPLNWISLNLDYTSQYTWTNPTPDRVNTQGNTAKVVSNFKVQSTLNVKSVLETIGLRESSSSKAVVPDQSGIKRKMPPKQDGVETDTSQANQLFAVLKGIGLLASTLTQFDQVSMNFSQTNTKQNAGLTGTPGWLYFFPFDQISKADSTKTPASLGYQMGLGSYAGSHITGSSLQFTDQYAQTNTFTASTTWSPASNFRVSFSWSSSWSSNKQVVSTSDTVSQVTRTGSLSRTHISLFRDVNDFRKNLDSTITSSTLKLSRAFERNMEPTGLGRFAGNLFGLSAAGIELLPLPNWQISWSGLETLPILNLFAKTASLEHAYSSTYASSYTQSATVTEKQVQSATITEQISPLIGLNIGWYFGLSSLFSYTKSRSIQLSPSNNSISQTKSSQFSVTLSYQKQGFKIPLFGGTLNNNLGFAFTFAMADEETQTFTFDTEEDLPVSGTTRLSFEPRLSYDISSKVSSSIYWNYSHVMPKESGSSTYETTTQEVGFSFRISIGG
ncbi:cell surface protein SprA [Chloroherpeton thalassium]|nr:cell surface protein SprA [Chloroherpeton thalassium]